MKWNNKGHEFDELGVKLKDISAIYLFGAGISGKTIYEKYQAKINIKGFIDNDSKKWDHEFCGLKVYQPENIKLLDNEAIVIATQPSFVNDIMKLLRNMGFNANIFSCQMFFPLLDMYKFGKLCLSSISFLPTTVCNLKCKHCLNFSPYIKKHQIRTLEQLKQDLDMLFSKIDMLLILHISGGEPFTYPYLPELIEYISENFKEQLGRLEMTTNGTVIPSDKLLKAMKNSNVYLTVDDYRDALPQYCEKYNDLLNRLDFYGIHYQILKADSWISLASFETNHTNLSDEQLCKYFDACSVPWQEYRGGKLYLCNYAAYAEIAEVQKELPPNDYIDLKQITEGNKIELLEFRLGYSNKGYTEFCKRCSGYYNNPYKIKAAEQLTIS